MLDRWRERLLKRLLKTQNKLAELGPEDNNFEVYRSEGNASVSAENYEKAEMAYRKAFSLRPTDTATLIGLGFVLKELGRPAEARVYLRRAISLGSDEAWLHEPHYLLGLIEENEDDLPVAIENLSAALKYKPDFEMAYRDLCRVLFLAKRPTEAMVVVNGGLTLNPRNPDFHFYAGNLHFEDGQFQLAIESYMKALEYGAINATVYFSLGVAYSRLGNDAMALENFKHAQAHDPGIAEVHYQSGLAYLNQGDLLPAIANFEMAVTLSPLLLKSHSGLLCALCMSSDSPLERYQQAALQYDLLLRSQVGSISAVRHHGQQRPLRVGFVSGDFKAHPVSFFLEGILKEIDPKRLCLIAYSNTRNEDHITARMRALFTEWFDTNELSDDAAATVIAAHQVDILIDLAGHTVEHRLPIFARRPAKIQVTWLGYFASTGLSAMDYILVDATSVPEQSTEFFSEKRWYLPNTRLCMTPPVATAETGVSPTPALKNGVVTFGSFQSLTKLSLKVLSVWARVLKKVPGAMLRLQVPQLDAANHRVELMRRLELSGIGSQSVSLISGTHWEEYLSAYQYVDILLDTFPFNGGTTTAEALWMGVPTITIRGNTMLSRQGAGMLACVGLHDWIAEDEDQFVLKASQFARDVDGLQRLRAGLRTKALASPLFDTRLFAENLQDALESIYQVSAEHVQVA
ncbi:MAG: tetratricopeptide repeat protein [Comamonadaceae bacterium]|nr:tetratricopeptide repeat protein [Comamonadaceae bacterium]